MNNFDVLLGMKLGGGGGSSTLVEKTITANGTYNPADDNADGYSSVTANVPNTYDLADEGKVVDSGALVGQTAKNIDANGLYDTTLNNSVNVSVPNSYSVADEGKVVSSGALVSQGAYPSTIVTNGTYDTTNYNSVTVDVPPTPAEPIVKKDVNFYDYDGTLVYSYTASDFANLTELPANPTHTGLTAQGWNWTLTDAKSYVADVGKLTIGQLYITDDGKTRLYVEVTNNTLSPYIQVRASGTTTSCEFDWGDGSEHTIATGGYPKAHHDYSTPGKYVITITVTNGSIGFFAYNNYPSSFISDGTTDKTTANYAYHATLYKLELGENWLPDAFYNTSVAMGALSYCSKLKAISIPNGLTDFGQQSFYNCCDLKFVTIPPSVTNYIRGFLFENCYSLVAVSIPNTITIIAIQAFHNCYSLTSVNVPSSVTSIENNAFQNCYSLDVITIDKPTNSITGSPWGATTGAFVYTQIIWHD